MVLFSFPEEEFLNLGLATASNWTNLEKTCLNTKTERFKSFFFASTKTVAELYRDIQHPDLGEHQIKKPDP